MPRHHKLTSWLILLAFALAACQPAAPAPVETVAPTLAPTEPPPAVTPTEPAPTPTPQPTAEAGGTATPGMAGMDVTEWTTTSPDGQWIAMGTISLPIGGGEQYHTRLEIVSTTGSTRWTAVDEWLPYGLGFTTPQPLRWSADGQAFYFTDLAVPDGCGIFANGTNLKRVDLATGEVAELVPSVGMAIGLSPDETRLAYRAFGDRGLVLRDIATGDEQVVPLDLGPMAQPGRIVWAPGGADFAVTVAQDICGGPEARHTIVRIDAESLEALVLAEGNEPQLSTVDWPELGRLRVVDQDGQHYWMNANTGALEPAAR